MEKNKYVLKDEWISFCCINEETNNQEFKKINIYTGEEKYLSKEEEDLYKLEEKNERLHNENVSVFSVIKELVCFMINKKFGCNL